MSEDRARRLSVVRDEAGKTLMGDELVKAAFGTAVAFIVQHVSDRDPELSRVLGVVDQLRVLAG